MIKIAIDDLEKDFRSIWYHPQTIPRPGGHTYSIEITKDEITLIDIMERMLGVKLTGPAFISEGINSGQDSSFNLVRYTLEYLKKNAESTSDYRIEWVFNNIMKVKIEAEKVVIEGIASQAIEDFDNIAK